MSVHTATAPELVVLLDEAGRATGTAAKSEVHGADTPLHLAFSLYLFDDQGNVLLTRRAADKKTFPGVWTNSCCGHPAPEEDLEAAVRRRVGQELGTSVTGLTLLLPRFRYQAEQDQVRENEMCPVFVGLAADDIRPDPIEVGDHRWEPWRDFRTAVIDGRTTVSPWCREQVALLPEHPLSAPAASSSDLPPAAQGHREEGREGGHVGAGSA